MKNKKNIGLDLRVVRLPKIFVSRHRSASESWSWVRCTGIKFFGHLQLIIFFFSFFQIFTKNFIQKNLIQKKKNIEKHGTYFSWSSTICSDVIGRLSGKTFIIKFFTFFCFDIFGLVSVSQCQLSLNRTFQTILPKKFSLLILWLR